MKEKIADNFMKEYSLNRCLKFSLLPQGNTLHYMNNEGFFHRDIKRAKYYGDVKEMINDYHRSFIDMALTEFKGLNWEKLEQALSEYKAASFEEKYKLAKDVEKVRVEYRNKIYEYFKSKKTFKILFCAKILNVVAEKYPITRKEYDKIKYFTNFAGYFKDFNETRKVMYSPKKDYNSIPCRIVDDNFPKYINNILIFREACKRYANLLPQLKKNMHIIDPDINVEEYFTLNGFNNALTQLGIDTYNLILGGRFVDGIKIQGLNELMNEFFQRSDKETREERLVCEPLYKQILCKGGKNWEAVFINYENDREVFDAIVAFKKEVFIEDSDNSKLILKSFDAIKNIATLSSTNLNKIYIRKSRFPEISKILTNKYCAIRQSIKYCVTENKGPCKNISRKAQRKKWGNQKVYTLKDIISALQANGYEIKADWSRSLYGDLTKLYNKCIKSYEAVVELYDKYKKYWKKNSSTNMLPKNEKDLEKLKKFLDLSMDLMQKFRLFEIDLEEDRYIEFYADYDRSLELINLIVPVYNKIRNYVTRKESEKNKVRINFDSPLLMDCWHRNKENDTLTTILLKDGKYYLAILNKNHQNKSKIFRELLADVDGDNYRKVSINSFSDWQTFLTRCSFTKNVHEHFRKFSNDYILDTKRFVKPLRITKKIYDLATTVYKNNNLSYKKYSVEYLRETDNVEEYNRAVQDWICFGYKFLESYGTTSAFDISDVKKMSFDNVADFYSEIQKCFYDLSFIDVSAKQVDKYVEDGDLFLFEIYCKDFSEYAHGHKDLNTLYFESIFDENNIKNPCIILQGGAQIFYRYATNKEPTKHKCGEYVVNRTYLNDKGISISMPEDVHLELVKHLNNKLKFDDLSVDAKTLLSSENIVYKKAKYDIIKDRRFTKNSFHLHLPYKINFESSDTSSVKLNSKVLNTIRKDKNLDVNVIGISRGERNLLFVTVINPEGKILKQKSLNVIDTGKAKIDYHQKLDLREKERQNQRRAWKEIQQIKDLKKGYISAAVRVICDMMLEYNAIIVMEDLSVKFKQSRFAIEKQIYQKFEKALIDKLNYLSAKPHVVDIDKTGGIQKGYQLSNKFESFKKLGKQSGFVFYVSPYKTSHVDPTTGFVNLFGDDLKYRSISKTQKFFNKMNSISFDEENNYFVFDFDYKKYHVPYKLQRSVWKVCSTNYDRYIWRKKTENEEAKYVRIDITTKLKQLFSEYGISYKNDDIHDKVCTGTYDSDFYRELLWLFNLLVRIRYYGPVSKNRVNDFIISPVKNSDDTFFVSDEDSSILPIHGAANSAYHIALKGLFTINNCVEDNDDKDIVKIKTNNKFSESWLNFVQNDK